jgi:hypothetical protein
MSDMVLQKNLAQLITPRLASAFTNVTAGGSGNNVAVTGLTLQRSLIKSPLNAGIALFFSAALGAANTLSLGTVKIQDSADGSSFADFLTFTNPGVVATGPTGGGTVTGQLLLSADLEGARDYIHLLFTPSLSAANTDTATLVAALLFAGFDRLPAPS